MENKMKLEKEDVFINNYELSENLFGKSVFHITLSILDPTDDVIEYIKKHIYQLVKMTLDVQEPKIDRDNEFEDNEFCDSIDEIFKNAIKKGLKDVDDWMYMYSDDEYDYFKHECTREYIKFKKKGK